MKNDSNNAAKQMIARYPDLKPYPKSAAENLRRELRAVFPQITFSVRYKSFSGGDEYHMKTGQRLKRSRRSLINTPMIRVNAML